MAIKCFKRAAYEKEYLDMNICFIFNSLPIFPAAFYPDLIFKVDEENFEEELEAFFEDYALDAVGEEALEKFTSGMISLVPSDSEVKNLMGQLPRSMLNQLVDYYRVDLDMFGYPVKQFFNQ